MNILIINLHSARNLGDDAILYETINGLKEIFPYASLTLAATDPDSWHRYCYDPSIKVIASFTAWVMYIKNGHWRARLSAAIIDIPLLILAALLYRLLRVKLLFGTKEKRHLLSAYYDADLVVSCGGGNLYAHFWLSPFFLMSLMALGFAIIIKKRIIMLPQSIGPIQGSLQRWITKILLNQVDKIMVREPRSADFLQKIIRLRKQVTLVPDLAFAPTPIKCSPLLCDVESNFLKIGVTAIDRAAQTRKKAFTAIQQAAYENLLVSALTEISRRYTARIYLFPQCTGPDLSHDDRKVLQRIYIRLQEQGIQAVLYGEFDSFLELKAAYAKMDCFIGSRMHTAIFALSLGIPVILIAYQPKSIGVMEYFGLSEFCYDINSLTSEQLINAFSKLLEDQERLRQTIQEKYCEVKEQLQIWRCEIAQ